MWKQLRQILAQQLSLYKEFGETLGQVKEALVSRDVDSLEKTVGQQAKIQERLRELEVERSRVCRRLGKDLGLAGSGRLSDLIRVAPPEEKKSLKSLQDRLREVLEEVRLQSRVMRYTVRTVLCYVEEAIGMFASLEFVGYSCTGKKERTFGRVYNLRA